MENPIEIRIWKIDKPGSLLATASAVIPTDWGDIVIERIRVIRKKDGEPWLALPQASYVKDGETRYQNIIQVPLRIRRQIETEAFRQLGIEENR